MGHIVVCGGSVVGLSLAMMLAGDGHRVTVLERDPAPPPSGPWDGWDRPGVAQFRQPHNLLPRFRLILDAELPGMVDGLVDAGCVWLDWLDVMPPLIRDRAPRAGDDRFRFVTGRRPVVEAVVAAAAADTDGVDIRRGVTVTGLRTTGATHVTGVHTAAGESIDADLVVDAMGRRSRLADWLTAAGGAAPHVETEDCGFVYHSRYFKGAELPPFKAPPVSDIGTISLLTLPGDNGTWSVTVWAASSDTSLRGLRDPERFLDVVRACPAHAHWADGEPITDVLTAGGILDRYRRFVVEGRPVATGVVAVGDAWACTNPSAGRGLSVGLLHAQLLRDLLREQPGVDADLALAWDARTEQVVAPFVTGQHLTDRQRIAEMEAERDGTPLPPPLLPVVRLMTAGLRDADLFRALVETVTCLATPAEVMARPGVAEGVARLGLDERPPLPGPTRSQLEALLA